MTIRQWQTEQYSARYLRLLSEATREKRDQHTMEWLDPQPQDEVLELGAGDGRLALQLAPHVKRVIAVEMAVPMIRRARLAARRTGVTNISFQVAGFLDFETRRGSVTKVITRDAFHHLPDPYKRSALERMCNALESGGVLLIQDIIFPFPLSSLAERLPEVVEMASAELGTDVAQEMSLIARRQHPIAVEDLTVMLNKIGLDVEAADTRFGCYTTLRCVKRS